MRKRKAGRAKPARPILSLREEKHVSITTLSIDTGIQEFQINNGGVLRFNPSDPNVYNRFSAR